jgi:hypothetical protein
MAGQLFESDDGTTGIALNLETKKNNGAKVQSKC